MNGSTQTYSYFKNGANPLNGQRLQSDGATAYTWSTLGSLATSTGPGGSFTFAPAQWIPNVGSISGGTTAAYTYDYLGRRSTKTVGQTATFLYDGHNLASETTGSVPKYYLYGPGIDGPLAAYLPSGPNSGFHYFDVDGLGSVVATNSPTGTVEHNAVFDAWGQTRSESGTRFHPFTYTGREVGEAGLLYYRARYYQPSVGRLTQMDPVGAPERSAYAYVGDNPVLFTDPSGLTKCPPNVLRYLNDFLPMLGQVAARTGIDVDLLIALSSHESGWANDHNRSLHNLWGLTHAGGKNLSFASFDAGNSYWESAWGGVLGGSKTIEDFTHRLIQDPTHQYNANNAYPGVIKNQYEYWRRIKGVCLLEACPNPPVPVPFGPQL